MYSVQFNVPLALDILKSTEEIAGLTKYDEYQIFNLR